MNVRVDFCGPVLLVSKQVLQYSESATGFDEQHCEGVSQVMQMKVTESCCPQNLFYDMCDRVRVAPALENKPCPL